MLLLSVLVAVVASAGDAPAAAPAVRGASTATTPAAPSGSRAPAAPRSPAGSAAAPVPAGAPAAAPSRPGATDARNPKALAGDGPLDFRCDKMQVLTKPNRTICVGNVVFRRGPALVCCRRFEGFANDRWELEKGICTEDVRAQRGDELVWADRADYAAAEGELVLTGRPLLRRGQSLLEGERVVAHVREEQAKVDKPRGHLVQEPAAAPAAPMPPVQPVVEGPLPATCPLPSSPRR